MYFWRNWRQSGRQCIKWVLISYYLLTIRCALILEGEFWEKVFYYIHLKHTFTSNHKTEFYLKENVFASFCFVIFFIVLPLHIDCCEREHDRCCFTVDITLLNMQGRWFYSRWISVTSCVIFIALAYRKHFGGDKVCLTIHSFRTCYCCTSNYCHETKQYSGYSQNNFDIVPAVGPDLA